MGDQSDIHTGGGASIGGDVQAARDWLEAEGIGRPSTYASIIDTIQRRGYVIKQRNALVPTFTAFAVTELLEKHFSDLVDIRFTARMEQQLDDIAEGELDWQQHLRDFYFGEGDSARGLEAQIASQEPTIECPRLKIGDHPETGKPIVVRVGRYGPYLQQDSDNGERLAASVPDDLPPADLTLQEAIDLLEKAAKGAQLLGHHPDTGREISAFIRTAAKKSSRRRAGSDPTSSVAAKPARCRQPRTSTRSSSNERSSCCPSRRPDAVSGAPRGRR